MTGCIYADSNFDDNYRWSVAHQVIRCTPGSVHHLSSGWLSKTGATSSHTSSFQHATLQQFTDAVVLLGGWRFDFTSGDHHINKVALDLEQLAFDRAAGRVDWRARGTYIDKNHDDRYRWQYWCTVLAFNGWHTVASFSGSKARGSAAHAGEVIDPQLRTYEKVLVIPAGWSFDYAEADHHINENGFRIQNVAFDRVAGKVTWTAHLHYCDKNRDDPFSWKYRVVVIGTNDADCADVLHGPIKDDGGLAVASLNVALAELMRPVTWTNGIMDGDETGVDCGGSSPARPMKCIGEVNPGSASSANLFSLKSRDDLAIVRAYSNTRCLSTPLRTTPIRPHSTLA